MCAIIFSLQALPMTFVAIVAFNNFSLRTVLTVSAILQLSGAWFRMAAFSMDQFWPVLVGSTVQSLSNTFLLSSPNLIINNWFPVNEIGIASSISSMAIPVGSMFGMGITGYLFDNAADIKSTM